MKIRTKRILALVLSVVIMSVVVEPVRATTITDLENLIEQNKGKLEEINDQIGDIESAQDVLEEEIADLNAEMLNLMTSIGLLEDSIAQKEVDIAAAEVEYKNALASEKKQYEEMLVRMQFMYEQGDNNLLSMLFGAESFADMVNKADYIEQLYSYDRQCLAKYQETTVRVQELKTNLETEKAALLADMASVEEQEAELDVILTKKKAEVKNYDKMLADAKKQAKKFKDKIKQEQKELEKLQSGNASGTTPGNTAANNGSYNVTGFDVSIIDNSAGSTTGKNIAKYGCQFIGNPYVYGGTSLTNGADCSGFTYRIYFDFGYNIPRTSTAQRSCGTAVSYENAQPGDLICYDGHVGLYCGGGYIVHASTEKTGIKISQATYRKILAVRRIVQ